MTKVFGEFLAAGPQRREQLTPEVYDVYRAFGFDPQVHTPEHVNEMLTTRPAVAYRVIGWYNSLPPDSIGLASTTSDGAQFRHFADARAHAATMAKVASIEMVEQPSFWYETPAHYNRLRTMTAAELVALQNHWRSLPND